MFKANFNTSWLSTRWVPTSEHGMTCTVDANVLQYITVYNSLQQVHHLLHSRVEKGRDAHQREVCLIAGLLSLKQALVYQWFGWNPESLHGTKYKIYCKVFCAHKNFTITWFGGYTTIYFAFWSYMEFFFIWKSFWRQFIS